MNKSRGGLTDPAPSSKKKSSSDDETEDLRGEKREIEVSVDAPKKKSESKDERWR